MEGPELAAADFDPAEAFEVIFGERRWTVACGDCLDVLDRLPTWSVDAIVTDPPAGIRFMGRAWDDDKGGAEEWIAWLASCFRAAFRVLKPGGHALVWALPRTSHWTGAALELAGFEVRDRIEHVFGEGFPKSLDVSKELDRLLGAERAPILVPTKPGNLPEQAGPIALGATGLRNIAPPITPSAVAWKGWGTGLKPAIEDWWLARKPLVGTVAESVRELGTGALNIDGCRVAHASAEDFAKHAARVASIKDRGWARRDSDVQFNTSPIENCSDASPLGRWPAHVVFSHGPDCKPTGTRKVKASPPWTPSSRDAPLFTGAASSPVHHSDGDGTETVTAWDCADGCPVAELDRQSGVSPVPTPRWGREDGRGWGMSDGGTVQAYGDEGGASRYFTQFPFDEEAARVDLFFYSPKPARAEREEGCRHLAPQNVTGRKDGSAGTDSPRAGTGRKSNRHNYHPTVKGQRLMRWLCRLITPPDGVVLDPFAGSGSTGVACSIERFRFIGVEAAPGHCDIARARIYAGGAPLLDWRGAQ